MMRALDRDDAEVRAAAAAVPYEGIPVVIAGAVHIVPAMSVATATAHWERIEQAQAGRVTGPALFSLTADLLHACLLRNYPKMPRGLVEDHLDVDNHAELNAACFGRGAWLRWVEMNSLGNALLALPAGDPAGGAGSGATSSPPSSPAPAGDGVMSSS